MRALMSHLFSSAMQQSRAATFSRYATDLLNPCKTYLSPNPPPSVIIPHAVPYPNPPPARADRSRRHSLALAVLLALSVLASGV